MTNLRNIEKPYNQLKIKTAQRAASPWRQIRGEVIRFGDMIERQKGILTPANIHEVGQYPHELPWMFDNKFPRVYRKLR